MKARKADTFLYGVGLTTHVIKSKTNFTIMLQKKQLRKLSKKLPLQNPQVAWVSAVDAFGRSA